MIHIALIYLLNVELRGIGGRFDNYFKTFLGDLPVKRVGLIITRMVAGGAAKVVRQIIDGGQGRYEFVLLTGCENVDSKELDDLKELCEIRWIPELARAISPIRDFRAYRRLRSEIRRLKLDVAHTHTSKAGVLGRFAAFAENVPRIIHSTHGSIYETDGQIDGVPDISIIKRVFLKIDQAAASRADYLTVLSEREKRMSLELGLCEERRLRVVPNGIDAADFAVDNAERRSSREDLGYDDDDRVVLSIGRLSAEKGHAVLLDAFAEIAESADLPYLPRLLIVGDGPEMPSLKRRAAEIAGIEFEDGAMEFGHIRFAGHSREIRGFLAAADVFVLPSLYEGFGIVLLEAMAAALPIVATKTGGVPEIIENGVEGVLVSPAVPSELASAVLAILTNPTYSANLSAAGIQKVRHYSTERMLEAYFTLYSESF